MGKKYFLLPRKNNEVSKLQATWKIQCKLPPKTKRFCPLVLK